MTVTLDRRLQRLEESLSSAEAAALWLTDAKQRHGALADYLAWLRDNPASNPVEVLPRQVAVWARAEARGQHDRFVDVRVEQAVRSVLARVLLVQEVNSGLYWNQEPASRELVYLRDLALYVLRAKANSDRYARWVENLTRLLGETLTWQALGEELGRRYFGGESPLFGEAAEHVAAVQAGCQALVDHHNRAIVRRRKLPGEPIDVAALHELAASQVDEPIAQLVARARAQVVVLLREPGRAEWLNKLSSGAGA